MKQFHVGAIFFLLSYTWQVNHHAEGSVCTLTDTLVLMAEQDVNINGMRYVLTEDNEIVSRLSKENVFTSHSSVHGLNSKTLLTSCNGKHDCFFSLLPHYSPTPPTLF